MDIDTTPYWENIYLYQRESDFASGMIKNDKVRVCIYKHSIRFINDECNLNHGGEFNRS